ncbi:MAG: hypothetical protein GC186_01005 [Rhodobacteraceae bacterium]|nr:hypothetical protein [Paracoccaceae bacterium]
MPGKGSSDDADTRGVLIRADNGDVIAFDETGLILKLSDRVVDELRTRLGTAPAADPLDVLGDIDAWDLRQEGDWYRFTARIDDTPRGYQRRVEGGDIIAAAAGPLYGVLSLGGARRAGFNTGGPDFRHNVLAPGDHIGAVGLEGTDDAKPTDRLQAIPHATRDTLIADTLLGWRHTARQALPLFLTRTETDGTADVAALGDGRGYANFLSAADSLVAAAASLGKRPRVLAVGLDYGLEDVVSDSAALVRGLRALMARVERDFNQRGLHRPIFVATFESGTIEIDSHPVIAAHWELAWQHGAHDLVFSAPAYMFDIGRFGRPTDPARIRMAEMDAHAIAARLNREDWLCPLFLLAEYDGPRIRVTARALDDLVIDPADPFGAGPACGFSLAGTDAPVTITTVEVAADDPRALILTCDRTPTGAAAELRYAFGAVARGDDRPANRGAVRDGWSAASRTGGAALHRWAYPCALPLHPGAAS